MDSSIPPLRPDVVGVVTTPRPTATPARVQFSDLLSGGAQALVQGAQAALRSLPGSPLAAVAVRGPTGSPGVTLGLNLGQSPAFASAAAVTASPEGPGGSPTAGGLGGLAGASGAGGTAATDGNIESSMAQSQELNLYYLQVQEEVNAQNRTFTALSNVLEVEHNTAKTAIGNIH